MHTKVAVVFQPVHRACLETVSTSAGAAQKPKRAAPSKSIFVEARVEPRDSAGDANP